MFYYSLEDSFEQIESSNEEFFMILQKTFVFVMLIMI